MHRIDQDERTFHLKFYTAVSFYISSLSATLHVFNIQGFGNSSVQIFEIAGRKKTRETR